MGLYNASGAIRVAVVSGSSFTGVYAADGALNVIKAPGNTFVGAYHPCGALYVTLTTNATTGVKAPDGSLNVKTSGTATAQLVDVVSGSLTGEPLPTLGSPVGLLLLITNPS